MLSFFPRGVLDEILNLIESVSEGFPSYSYRNSHAPTANKSNKSSSSGEIYARLPILEKNIIGIPYSPVKSRDNRTKVDKILFTFCHSVQISTYCVEEWRL